MSHTFDHDRKPRGKALAFRLIGAVLVPQLLILVLFLLPPLSPHGAYAPWAMLAAGVAGLFWWGVRFEATIDDLRRLLDRWGQGDFSPPAVSQGYQAPDKLARLWDTARDVAELARRSQAELQARAARLEGVFQALPEGILVLDPEGQIWAFNEACHQMLRFEATDPRGKPLEAVIHDAKLAAYVQALRTNGRAGQIELAGGDAGSRSFEVQGARLMGQDHRPAGFLIFFHDVTRVRYLERVRRDFTANVSHELRTPLTLIHGFVETLLDGALDDRESAARFLQIIREQTERLDALMDDILSLAQLEREDQEPVPLEPLSVEDVVRESVELSRVRAQERNMTLEVTAEPQTMVLANSRLLEQALINLIDNAIKYSDPGKTIRITAEQRGPWVEIAVADQGWGIESRHLPRIFERFYRVDPGRSRELGGTGLGLSIVKHIMQIHRGEVDVESTLGKGSIFRLRLPAVSNLPSIA